MVLVDQLRQRAPGRRLRNGRRDSQRQHGHGDAIPPIPPQRSCRRPPGRTPPPRTVPSPSAVAASCAYAAANRRVLHAVKLPPPCPVPLTRGSRIRHEHQGDWGIPHRSAARMTRRTAAPGPSCDRRTTTWYACRFPALGAAHAACNTASIKRQRHRVRPKRPYGPPRLHSLKELHRAPPPSHPAKSNPRPARTLTPQPPASTPTKSRVRNPPPRGRSSGVEHHVANVIVVGSNPIARSERS